MNIADFAYRDLGEQQQSIDSHDVQIKAEHLMPVGGDMGGYPTDPLRRRAGLCPERQGFPDRTDPPPFLSVRFPAANLCQPRTIDEFVPDNPHSWPFSRVRDDLHL